MPVGRPPQGVLVLTEENRRLLLGYTRRAKSKNALSQRARIVLRLADGIPASTIAKEMQISNATVGKWRKRYIDKGVEGLLDEKRSGAPRKVTDEAVEKVLIDTLESTPRDATHWSTRQMAKKSGLSHMTVQRIWQAFGLQPHRVDSFRLSNDPQFIEKVRGYRRALSQSPGGGGGPLRRREVADPGPGTKPADHPHATGNP